MTAVIETAPEIDLDAPIHLGCGRCGGSGYIHAYQHIDGGRCFECGGTGAGETVTQRTLNRRAKDRERRAVKAAEKAAAKAAEIAASRDAYAKANPKVMEALEALNGEFGESLREALSDYGSLTEGQEQAVLRIAADKAAEPEATAVVEGRIKIVGEVKTTKWQDNAYGGSLKMLVLDDRGFKVWGSVPSALNSLAEDGTNVQSGDRVEFTATVEASQDDEAFGFYKRPSGAVLLDA